MRENLCTKCKAKPIFIKKRGLCEACYMAWYKEHGPVFSKNNPPKSRGVLKKIHHLSELEFVKNYFTHNNWYYECAKFKSDGISYTPDFYDGERDTFIELVGSRQGYDQRKQKIEWFKETFPKISLEIRTPNGELINQQTNGRIVWPQPESRSNF